MFKFVLQSWSKSNHAATQLTVSESITYLHVRAINACSSRAILQLGSCQFPCLLGKTGRTHTKREGDGKTPIGRWKLQQLYYRADKRGRPVAKLKTKPVTQKDGWCDAKGHGAYNRHVALPFKASHETLWRRDRAYDLVITTDHNQRPRIQGHGSAIFLHVINPSATGTEGCVALSEKHLRQLLSRCTRHTYLVI
jgi:L,D-peptidoglycan transpeptidase YkuD (ErfK/YbiS/YcfS/YnhG family)